MKPGSCISASAQAMLMLPVGGPHSEEQRPTGQCGAAGKASVWSGRVGEQGDRSLAFTCGRTVPGSDFPALRLRP